MLTDIPVFIRYQGDEFRTPIGRATAEDLDTLPGLISAWGIEGDSPTVFGQFFTRGGIAGFELVVSDE